MINEISEAIRDAEYRLKAMGYRPVYRGITSRGSASARVGDRTVVASAVLRVEGAVAWVGFDEKSRRAAFYIQPLGELL